MNALSVRLVWASSELFLCLNITIHVEIEVTSLEYVSQHHSITKRSALSRMLVNDHNLQVDFRKLNTKWSGVMWTPRLLSGTYMSRRRFFSCHTIISKWNLKNVISIDRVTVMHNSLQLRDELWQGYATYSTGRNMKSCVLLIHCSDFFFHLL